MTQIAKYLAIFLITIVMPSVTVAQVPTPPGYELAWADEFDGDKLNEELWIPGDTKKPTNNSLQDYLPSQISVTNGMLKILAENKPSRGLPYLSGLVTSTAEQKYGRWDVRAKLPTSKGMWPAIWLLPDTSKDRWPSRGEIDIMENRGDQPKMVSSAFHYGENGDGKYKHDFDFTEQTAVHDGTEQNYHNDFHVYSVEWDPDQLRFYVDDVHHWTLRDAQVKHFLTKEVGKMQVVINTAVGGEFLDNPDDSTVWPQEFLIDYVRAYKKSEGPAKLSFENGGFEERDGSLACWTKFGDQENNAASGNAQVKSGNEALMLSGQSDKKQVDENFSGIEQGLSVKPGDAIFASAAAFVTSNDSFSDSGNAVLLKIDYYRKSHGAYGSPDYLSSDSLALIDASTNPDTWQTQVLKSTAPSDAVEARVAIVYAQRDTNGGTVCIDDVSIEVIPK